MSEKSNEKFENFFQEDESLDSATLAAAIRIQTEAVRKVNAMHCSAGVRGDALYKLAYLLFHDAQLLPSKDAITQSIVLRRMFYGRLSPEVKEALGMAKQVRDRLILHLPGLAMKRALNLQTGT